MSDVATLTITGHLGKDAEIKQTQNGATYAVFSVGANLYVRGESVAHWFSCKMFGGRAEKMAGWLVKGRPITVSGSFYMTEFDGRDGQKVKLNVIDVLDLKLHGQPDQAQRNTSPQTQNETPAPAAGTADLNDDIPF